jgi:hypothetical protein
MDNHPLYTRALRERDEARAERDNLIRDRDAVALELAALKSALRHLIQEYKNGHVQVYQSDKWAEYKRLAGMDEPLPQRNYQ